MMSFKEELLVTRGELEDLVALGLTSQRARLADEIIARHGKAQEPPKEVEVRVPIGSRWEEKRRRGHTVVITERTIDRWSREQMVHYLHVGIHNKRALSHGTITSEKRFLTRFERIS